MYMPADTITYAIGDIHGCPWLLDAVFDWIVSHAENHQSKQKTIVLLGDVVDRGPESRSVMDRLIAGPPDGFDMTCLRGNHEDMMLRTLNTGYGLMIWLQNGGRQTLESYGIEQIGDIERSSPAVVSALLKSAIPKMHQDFLNHTTFSLRQGNYLFVHAGIRPGVALDQQAPEDIMWIRRDFVESTADFGVIVVHGHSVRPEPNDRINAIGIDTGAVVSGRLSCVALWQDQREFFTTPSMKY